MRAKTQPIAYVILGGGAVALLGLLGMCAVVARLGGPAATVEAKSEAQRVAEVDAAIEAGDFELARARIKRIDRSNPRFTELDDAINDGARGISLRKIAELRGAAKWDAANEICKVELGGAPNDSAFVDACEPVRTALAQEGLRELISRANSVVSARKHCHDGESAQDLLDELERTEEGLWTERTHEVQKQLRRCARHKPPKKKSVGGSGGGTPKSSPAKKSKPVTSTPKRVCCKTCRKGKACGNSCISASKTCRQPPGCACNG